MPKAPHLELGQFGEQAAADYLLGLGWQVLDRNWRCAGGELDIIAREGDEIVFVEVKARRGVPAEDAFARVDRRKQASLAQAAGQYLDAHGLSESAWRIDVIAVTLLRDQPTIEHVRDALTW